MVSLIPWLISAVAALALVAGPIRFVVRAALRWRLGVRPMRRWERSVSAGLQAGSVAALVLVAATAPGLAGLAAILALLLALAGADLAWRWLPHEWTGALGCVAGLIALQDGTIAEAALGAAIGGGTLWALQALHRVARGAEGLGTGDVLLAAALGGLVGPSSIALVLALAALTGLVQAAVMRLRQGADLRQYQVAFGAHLALSSLIFLN